MRTAHKLFLGKNQPYYSLHTDRLFRLLFCVEIVCKTVLAQYYQIASSLSMAANNKLGDYTGAIFKGIFMNIIGILLMLLPFILLLTVLRKRIKFGQKPVAMSVLVIIGTIFFHMFGLLSLKRPTVEN